jgi:hypothetical protein
MDEPVFPGCALKTRRFASGFRRKRVYICAIVARGAISAFGGSSAQISGLTGAFVIVVFGIVARYGVDILLSGSVKDGKVSLFSVRSVPSLTHHR